MLLDEEDLNLINNISENETYLEDSTDETKDHVLSLIEDVPFTELGNEEQIKLYMGAYRGLYNCRNAYHVYYSNHFFYFNYFI